MSDTPESRPSFKPWGMPSQPSAGESRSPDPDLPLLASFTSGCSGSPAPLCAPGLAFLGWDSSAPLFLLRLVFFTLQCQPAFPTPALPCSPYSAQNPGPALNLSRLPEAQRTEPRASPGVLPMKPPAALQTTGSPAGVGFPVPAARCPARSLQHALLAQVPAVSPGPPLWPGS